MSDQLNRSLRTGHRTVLAMIAVCAVLAAMQFSDGEEPAPEPVTTTVALSLAVATIVARRVSTSPVIAARTRVTLIVCAWAFAFAIALLGAFLAMVEGQTQAGLVFAVAAGIFCLRPPAPIADSPGA
jgi:hypothetical protein